MFNREVKVDLVKKGKSNKDETNPNYIGFEDKAKIIGGLLDNSVKKIGIAVCAYVLLDTVRKVAVASVAP
jgi:hypothetical protein